MSNRKLQLVSPEVGALMVKQIAHELKNYNLYRTFANYFSVEGILDLETYYRKRADEEYNHHEWLSTYLSEADFRFAYPAIEVNTEKITSYLDPFVQTVDREIQTTQLIYAIYKQCESEGDIMTCSWLYEKLIKEQVEEENLSRMARTLMEETSDIYLRAERVLDLLEG